MTTLRIGIMGDFDSQSYPHQATNAALHHAAASLSIQVEPTWLPTLQLETPDREQRLRRYHALWAAPGSPYRSLEGAVQGIRFARQHNWPFFGT
jgi:CTP synthase (UTP-ammonia lyase)